MIEETSRWGQLLTAVSARKKPSELERMNGYGRLKIRKPHKAELVTDRARIAQFFNG